MERYSKLQLKQLTALINQIEARLTRTKIVALINEWRHKQNIGNYTSEYDRIRNELSTSAIPFHTQGGINKGTLEFEKWVHKYIILYHNLSSIDIYI